MSSTENHKIRPSGRHLLTIGRDLIQDQQAAIVELVKNAYDADAVEVHVTIECDDTPFLVEITISDNGHGMSDDTVINKWLVPSTRDKLDRLKSPKGRTMQGRKGVGRYAASILGDDLLLETTTESKLKTEVYLEWKKFEDAEYLDDVDVLVKTGESFSNPGTLLVITGGKEFVQTWTREQVEKLHFELRKLISPVDHEVAGEKEKDRFSIFFKAHGIFGESHIVINEKIKPVPLFDLFDYKIYGRIDSTGNGKLTFINQKAKNTLTEHIDFNFEQPTKCGSLSVDIRVYDREPDAIKQLIKRGLKNESTGKYVGKLEARRLLSQFNGIGVYRNGFRIRPLGDPEFDWLKLNEKRVNNPSLRIGSNQVIGYVQIESEEQSDLQEKSARDGLRENFAYLQLKEISHHILSELEVRRFEFRKKAGLSRVTLTVERELERLFSFNELKKGISKRLKNSGLDKKAADEIIEVITEEESKKNKLAEELRKTIAIYQGQATLGKIINVVLHEGRRPLNYFRNQIPNLEFWADEIRNNYDPAIFDDLIPITKGLESNADVFVKLFSRLDPLASGKRGKKAKVNIRKTAEESLMVFENIMLKNNISHQTTGPDKIDVMAWQNDLYVIFTNLIDNSVFWMTEKNVERAAISIDIQVSDGVLEYVDYRDNGPGIEPYLIESGIIFDPEFTTKHNGAGLGLAISGEAANRNNMNLLALESDNGAYFRLQPEDQLE